jgi:hypothetical protein
MGAGGGTLNPAFAIEPGILSLRLHDRSVLASNRTSAAHCLGHGPDKKELTVLEMPLIGMTGRVLR